MRLRTTTSRQQSRRYPSLVVGAVAWGVLLDSRLCVSDVRMCGMVRVVRWC